MKNSKVTKILAAMLCLVMIFTISTPVFATDKKETAGTTVGPVTINPDTTGTGATGATNVGNDIIGVIQVVGILIAVGTIMILGIKYMMGSAEEKAEYKKTLMPYLIGAILLFAGAAFAQTIYNWAIQLGQP